MAQEDLEEGSRMTAFPDSLLLERAHQGDIASFDALFYRHYDRVYGLLFRLVGNRDEAEELAQEVFLKLYQQRFNRGQAHNIGGWLYRVATNAGYNEIRSRKRRWQRDTALLPDPSDAAVDPAEATARNETRRAVRSALLRLPERQVQLLLMRQMGLSYAELADYCDVAPASVGTMLRRAAENFRDAYQEEVQSR
jgi:RNA polymerase sigma-70 factor (ECF subfamily)